MNSLDKLAFMPLRYLMPAMWLSVVVFTAIVSSYYFKSDLQKSVSEDMFSDVSYIFLESNKALSYALKSGIDQEKLKKLEHIHDFKDVANTVLGIIDKDGKADLLLGDNKSFKKYLVDDFPHKSDFIADVREQICAKKGMLYSTWISEDTFYLIKSLDDSCHGNLHILRYSVKDKVDEQVNKTFDVIVFYSLFLLGSIFLVGAFSYFIIYSRLKKLLDMINGFRQSDVHKEKSFGGKDEIAEIAKAFCNMKGRLNAVLDDMYTFVALLDKDGYIEFVNNTPLQICNIEYSVVEGKRLCDAYWWEYDSKKQLEIEELLIRCTHGEIINHETQIQIAGGQLIWITFSMHPVYDDEGHIEHLVAEGVNISAQKEAYEMMLHQTRKAQMGDMISIIAHQWRQPLSLISTLSNQVMLDNEIGIVEQENLRKAMDKILSTVVHMSSTMRQFTGFFNPNKLPQMTSFSKIVNKSLEIIGSRLNEEHIDLSIIREADISVQSFEEELIQVVIDMLQNAADQFAKNSIEHPQIEIREFVQDEYLCLHIKDNAGGVDEETAKKIFDPYFTTKETTSSSGLGLHMSKMIVQDHCFGKLNLIRHEDGVTFEIALPIKRRDGK